jgi:hypothetical protein
MLYQLSYARTQFTMSFSTSRASETDIHNISRMLYLTDTPAYILSTCAEDTSKNYGLVLPWRWVRKFRTLFENKRQNPCKVISATDCSALMPFRTAGWVSSAARQCSIKSPVSSKGALTNSRGSSPHRSAPSPRGRRSLFLYLGTQKPPRGDFCLQQRIFLITRF